ncbi:hypothetical protein [Oecophyllibacter saccharovorans]|uniref:hypothetical protein n=1 Tax=Oecophyllibacter saccharovorans TaxID=2558360 RepID=UPI00116AF641|nr:hypothetical protein [Oecophyllibacter saccharovorans]TPW36612.1 hypothetical protein E3203_02280 [Oecophyllibacter saccharovorans]
MTVNTPPENTPENNSGNTPENTQGTRLATFTFKGETLAFRIGDQPGEDATYLSGVMSAIAGTCLKELLGHHLRCTMCGCGDAVCPGRYDDPFKLPLKSGTTVPYYAFGCLSCGHLQTFAYNIIHELMEKYGVGRVHFISEEEGETGPAKVDRVIGTIPLATC